MDDIAGRILRHNTIRGPGLIKNREGRVKMKTEIVRYQCVSGYVDDAAGMYLVGEEIDGIGAVQYIEDVEE